jgi:broad specificity phosphatase PhoE
VTEDATASSPAASGIVPEGLDATLVLVRHGETEWIRENRFQGQGETELSATGRLQATMVAERLAHPHDPPSLPVPGGRPRQILYSPLARTRETAGAIADALGREEPVELVAEPGIIEIGQGEWEGVHQDEIARRWPDVLSGWRRRPWETWAPGGESPAQVQERVAPALARVLGRLGEGYPRGSLDRPQVHGYAGVGARADQPWSVLVGHDGVFKVAMLTLFGLPLTHFWMFTLALTGVTIVEIRGGRPVVRAANLTDHLAPLLDDAAREAAERRARSGAM